MAGRSQLQQDSATRGRGGGGTGAITGAAEDFVGKAIGGEAGGFGNGVAVTLDIEDGAGVVVPMPTLVSALAPLTLLMEPRMSELLWVTEALAPIAVPLLTPEWTLVL